jgi:hypothetical protein
MRVRLDHYVELDVEPVGDDPAVIRLLARKAGSTSSVAPRPVEVEFAGVTGWSSPRDGTIGTDPNGLLEIDVPARLPHSGARPLADTAIARSPRNLAP